jgi:hypothetical protein
MRITARRGSALGRATGHAMEGLEGRRLLTAATLLKDVTARDASANPTLYVSTGGVS